MIAAPGVSLDTVQPTQGVTDDVAAEWSCPPFCAVLRGQIIIGCDWWDQIWHGPLAPVAWC